MSEERLEEMDYIEQAKQLVRNYDKLSQSNNIILTYTGRCAIAKVIEQAERVQQLKEDKEELYKLNQRIGNKAWEIEQQNKRYREDISVAMGIIAYNRTSKENKIYEILSESLEESE